VNPSFGEKRGGEGNSITSTPVGFIGTLDVDHGGRHTKDGADMLVSLIGRVISLPGILYDPSICDIVASHRPSIAIGRVDLRGGSKLGPVRRPGSAGVGTEIQKVKKERSLSLWMVRLTCCCDTAN